MKPHRLRLKSMWLPVAALLLVGLASSILMSRAQVGMALARERPLTEVYYDYPARGADSPAAYVIGAKWDKSVVTYGFSNCPRSLDCAAAQQQVREAIEAWDAVCGLTLNEVPANADIKIGWYTGNHGDGNPFDGPGNVLAHAFFPLPYLGDLGGDVHFDDAEIWVVGRPTGPYQVHLKTTAMHEVGHALGLDHSSDPTALMWDHYTGIRTIGPDDIAGIQALYGPPGPNEGNPAPPGAANVTATATTAVRVRNGPGTNFDQIETVDANATVPVLGRNATSDWLYIEINGHQGWVAAFLFSITGDLNSVPVVDQNGGGANEPPPAVPPAGPQQPPAGQPSPQPPMAPGAVTGVATSTVRVRSGPGTNYQPLGAVDAGTRVNIVGRNVTGSWVLIQSQNGQGWAATWLFEITGDINSVPVVEAQTIEDLTGAVARLIWMPRHSLSW
jgi:uncharacterized protein YraI/predicted Zn-dependent protease